MSSLHPQYLWCKTVPLTFEQTILFHGYPLGNRHDVLVSNCLQIRGVVQEKHISISHVFIVIIRSFLIMYLFESSSNAFLFLDINGKPISNVNGFLPCVFSFLIGTLLMPLLRFGILTNLVSI